MAHHVDNLPLYTDEQMTRDSIDTNSSRNDGGSPNSSSTRLSFPHSVRSVATTMYSNQPYQPPSPPPPLPTSTPSELPPRTKAKSMRGAAAIQAARAAAKAVNRPLIPRSISASTIKSNKSSSNKEVDPPPPSPRLKVTTNGAELNSSPPTSYLYEQQRQRGDSSSTSEKGPRIARTRSTTSPEIVLSSTSTPRNPERPGTAGSIASSKSQEAYRSFPPRSPSGSLAPYIDGKISAPQTIALQQHPSSPISSPNTSPVQQFSPTIPAAPLPSSSSYSLAPPSPDERTRHSSSPQPTNGHGHQSNNFPPSSSSHSFFSSSSATFHTLSAKLQSARLIDKIQVVGEQAKGWSVKGKGRLADSFNRAVTNTSSSKSSLEHRPEANGQTYLDPTMMNRSHSNATSAGGTSGSRAPSPSSSLDGSGGAGGDHLPGIKLPCTILGVRVPKRCGMAFGVRLELAVKLASVASTDSLHRKRSDDPVAGDEARKWLPAVAYRCLEYLEEWGQKEEGIYRVPGRSNSINSLRALFDAGMDKDLREIHPGDLDPHAVASLFKSWLRELPEPLLSSNLEGAIDLLSQDAIGYSASSSNFLSQQRPNTGSGGPPKVAGLVDGRAPKQYLEKLRGLFGNGMPAEHFYLLRSVGYHLARLASFSNTNKMTLSNLRLILSPTLRLSPVFVQVLVEEREILFGKLNEDSRARELSLASPTIQSPTVAQNYPTSRKGSIAGSFTGSTKSSARYIPIINHPDQAFSPTQSTFSHDLHPNDYDEGAETLTATALSPTTPTFPNNPDSHLAPNPFDQSALPFRTPIAEKFANVRASPVLPDEVSPKPGSIASFESVASTSNKPAFLPSRNNINGRSHFGASRDIKDPASSNGAPKKKVEEMNKSGDAKQFQLDMPKGLGLDLPESTIAKEEMTGEENDPWGLFQR